MRISDQDRITIPKPLRDRFGLDHNTEVEIVPTEQGLLLQKRVSSTHPAIDRQQASTKNPVERVYGILNKANANSYAINVDGYMEDIRGR